MSGYRCTCSPLGRACPTPDECDLYAAPTPPPAPSPAAAGLPAEDAHAPAWVHAVTPAEIVRQRALRWPDFHPEDFCHQCGRRNPVWFADTEVWQEATGSTGDGGGILCPSCFAALYRLATGRDAIIWRLSIDPRSRDYPEAAAALAEMRPTAAEEAVKRLIAAAPVMWHGDYPVKAVPVSDLLSALAAPASHGADGGERR